MFIFLAFFSVVGFLFIFKTPIAFGYDHRCDYFCTSTQATTKFCCPDDPNNCVDVYNDYKWAVCYSSTDIFNIPVPSCKNYTACTTNCPSGQKVCVPNHWHHSLVGEMETTECEVYSLECGCIEQQGGSYCDGSTCKSSGILCINKEECCSGNCQGGVCSSASCFSNGLSCVWNSDCCSGYCTPWAPHSCAEPPPVPSCAIQSLSCPATCTIGQNFNVSYDFRNTDYTTKPNISQRLANSGYSTLWCLADQTVNDNLWHSAVRTIPCTDITDIVRVGGHSNAGHWTDWCDYSWTNAQIGSGFGCYGGYCNVTPVPAIPPAIGYVKIKHPGLGILRLRLISFANAKIALKGIVKVARFNGDINTAADLVETNDPNASPVRIKTPYGIKSWRMQR